MVTISKKIHQSKSIGQATRDTSRAYDRRRLKKSECDGTTSFRTCQRSDSARTTPSGVNKKCEASESNRDMKHHVANHPATAKCAKQSMKPSSDCTGPTIVTLGSVETL